MNYNIIKALEDKNIEYKVSGQDIKVKCLNPDHEDSNPSLNIHKDTGQYNCWSCGFSGENILVFFNREQSAAYTKSLLLKNKIKDMIYESKGIELPESIYYIENDFRRIPKSLLQKYEAFTHEKYGEGRIAFPIKDSLDKVIGVMARRKDSNVSPKYLVYPAQVALPIYPFRKGSTLVLVEGIFDVLNLEAHDFSLNTSAVFGTKNLTYKNVKEKLMPFIISGLHTVVVMLDKDKAGTAAAEYIKKVIEYKTELRVVIANDVLPDNKDPGDLTVDEVKQVENELTRRLNLSYNI